MVRPLELHVFIGEDDIEPAARCAIFDLIGAPFEREDGLSTENRSASGSAESEQSAGP